MDKDSGHSVPWASQRADGSRAQAERGVQRLYDRLLVALAIVLFAAPILRGLVARGLLHAYAYLAGDCFYYLVLARNVVLYGHFAYDREYPTNGFHPLWQLWVTLLYKLAAWLSVPDHAFPVVVLLSSVVFISIAIWVLGKCFIADRGNVPVLFPILPVGVYGLVSVWAQPTYGPLWSYADGMESCLVILSWSLLLYVMVRPGFLESVTSALLTGVVVAFMCLARLDHALFTVPLFAGLALQCLWRRNMKRFILTVLAGVPVIVAMAVYFAINIYYAGVALPLSGIVKTSFPHADVWGFWYEFVNAANDFGQYWSYGVLWRINQIVIPMAFAIVALLRALVLLARKRLSQLDFALAVSACFVLLLGPYNWLYVRLCHQGQWYFPLSVLFVSVFTFQALGRFMPSALLNNRRGWWLVALSFVVVEAFSLLYWRGGHTGSYHFLLTEEAPIVREHYEGQNIKLLEYDDGILAYGTGFQCMSGTLLAADKAAVEHVIKEGKSLLPLAYERGFDRVASWGYYTPQEIEYESCSREIEHLIRSTGYLPQEMERLGASSPFLFSVDYVSPSRLLKILRLRPVDEHYLAAQDLRRAGDWKATAEALERAAETGAAPVDLFFNELGEAYIRTGRTQDAQTAFQRALEENLAILERYPEPPAALREYIGEVHFNAAWAYARLGNATQAQTAYDKAVALDPENTEYPSRFEALSASRGLPQ